LTKVGRWARLFTLHVTRVVMKLVVANLRPKRGPKTSERKFKTKILEVKYLH
jgi:hypothetical protein